MSRENAAYNLEPLWGELLAIYREFARICDRRGMRYYACGGTALGAVRHQGFIPWDDDLDIFMPRPDYTRFVETVQGELEQSGLGARYRWRSFETEPGYGHSFGRLQLADESAVAAIRRDSRLPLPLGICVDVIPLDGIPQKGVKLFLWLAVRSAWRHLPRFISSRRKALLMYQRFLAAIPFDTAERVEDSKEDASRLRRTNWPPQMFANPVLLPFCDVKVPLPRDWRTYLSDMIGADYMQLPPPSSRVPSHARGDSTGFA